MSTNTVDTANQLLAENAELSAEVARLNEQVRALQSDATLAADTLKNANDVVLEAKAKFERTSDENIDLRLQLLALVPDWVFVSESGKPLIPVGERAEFWVCHVGKGGQHSVTKLTWFNHVEPHEDDQDAIDCCEMSTPDGENYWPIGWHEEFSSHDFDHFYEPSRLKVVAYAPFVAPALPINLRAGEVPNV